ncbi:pyrimidine dimer DNA glycosylase/endonuclease V [Lysinibacter sp. HNR]|uniref:pyrimidine dimer DNA glycosylase/endonuclease V n=1 Tax=Lysinibacter sp. HNR TaxID=3031408 RepID=UPI002435C704|nr:pyrimidine dimer DNA glycosylase/endonuclease V [Lysinibacter sp. HNR]WGD38345.1 pyrimidine dimer DNA glycosylase/endonuclease V [Lysinibacter sp. HNR]
MRIWSLDPSYLDRIGLIACWRETLLAQKVLMGQTKGYTRHPQLERFREAKDPERAIATYLHLLSKEATARGYSFNGSLILNPPDPELRIPVTQGQLWYEFEWLLTKLDVRSPERAKNLRAVHDTETVPMEAAVFSVVPGPIANWEIVAP